MPEDQKTPFAAHIELFPLEECIIIVQYAVKDYYNQMIPRNDGISKDDDDVDLAAPALKTLLALFPDHMEFEDDAAAEGFLQDRGRADDPYVLGVLLGWTHELYSKISTLVNRGPMFAHTARELVDQIEPFIQTVEKPMIETEPGDFIDCSVWAFVKLAR